MPHPWPHSPAPQMSVKKLNLNGALRLSESDIQDSVNRALVYRSLCDTSASNSDIKIISQSNSFQSLKVALVTSSTTGQKLLLQHHNPPLTLTHRRGAVSCPPFMLLYCPKWFHMCTLHKVRPRQKLRSGGCASFPQAPG